MAHINQREVREQRRRRKKAFLGIFLLIPLFLAVYFFISISSRTLNADTVKQIVLTQSSTSATQTLVERDEIALCMTAIRNATEIKSAARPISEYREVLLTCSDDYSRANYALYFSESANDVLIKTAESPVYKNLKPEDAMALMVHPVFRFLYPTAPEALTVTLGEEEKTVGASYVWHYFLADETEETAEHSETKPTIEAKGTLPVFNVPGDPDETTLTVTVNGDVKTGNIADLREFLGKKPVKADVCLSATWSNPEADGCYGTAEYRFTLDYTPAEA
ncbi:MAG: hypothetical protein II328_00800 [Clostridia bacterium]|nr:hypothetical protein [Clostridia bacterium]